MTECKTQRTSCVVGFYQEELVTVMNSEPCQFSYLQTIDTVIINYYM